jgi:DNA-nicking Smr family endonuclease
MCAEDDTTELPIDGVLDLHPFRPGDVKDLVTDYLAECRARGTLEVRIIHGKGTGALGRSVHSVLGKLPAVERFDLASGDAGGWGATLVTLRLLER